MPQSHARSRPRPSQFQPAITVGWDGIARETGQLHLAPLCAIGMAVGCEAGIEESRVATTTSHPHAMRDLELKLVLFSQVVNQAGNVK